MVKNKKKLNKFEKTRLLASRALEMAYGAKPKIKYDTTKFKTTRDYIKVAEEEFVSDKMDLEIYKK